MRLAALLIAIAFVGCQEEHSDDAALTDKPDANSAFGGVESIPDPRPEGDAVAGVDDARLLGIWERSKVWGEDYSGNSELDHMLWLIRDDGTCWLKTYTFAEDAMGRNRRGYNSNLVIDEKNGIMTTQGFDLRYSLAEVGRGYTLKVEFTEKDLHQEFFRLKIPKF